MALKQKLGKVVGGLASGGGKTGKAARWAGRGAVFAANPFLGTGLAVAEATARTGKGLTGGIRNVAKRGVSDTAMAAMRTGTPVERARSFAYRHPGITAAGAAAVVGPGLYSGGPGSGRRASSMNQNSYYVRRMRSGQSSGIAGLDPKSLGGFA